MELERLARHLVRGVGHRKLEIVVRIALVAVVELLDQGHERRDVERELLCARHVGSDREAERCEGSRHVIVRGCRQLHLGREADTRKKLLGEQRRGDADGEGLDAGVGLDIHLDGHGFARDLMYLCNIEALECDRRPGRRRGILLAARCQRYGCQSRHHDCKQSFHNNIIYIKQ